MFSSASQGILFKDCVTFYEFTVWFWHSISWNFTGICFTHPCSLLTCSFSEFHKTSWMKRIPLWQHPSIVSQAENDLWTHVLWRQSLVQLPGTFFLGSHVSIWSTKQSCGKVARRAANTGKQPRGLFGRNTICFGWEKKVSSSSVHASALLQLLLYSYSSSIPTCVIDLAIAWLHSLLVIFVHMSYLCSATCGLYSILTCDQRQRHKFELGILPVSQKSWFAKFLEEKKASRKWNTYLWKPKNWKSTDGQKLCNALLMHFGRCFDALGFFDKIYLFPRFTR